MRWITSRLAGLLTVAVLLAVAAPSVLAAGNTDTAEFIKSGDFDSVVIFCRTENIVVKQGGTELKVEVDSASESTYHMRDNTNIPMADRYFYYNKWDIIFERIDRRGTSGTYSATVTVTVPDGIESLLLRTDSGNIQAEGLECLELNVHSENGNVSVSNTGTEHIFVKSDGLIELTNVTATSDITINNKVYSESSTITVEGWK